jgi:hypothetical protein
MKAIIGNKIHMDVEHFHHRQKVIERKRQIDNILLDRDLWLEKDDFKPIYIASSRVKKPILKRIFLTLFELRP